jgi:hypothetical protein
VDIPFDRACALVESALQGTVRQDLVAEVCKLPLMGQALTRLRESLSANTFKSGPHQIYLDKWITVYDARTRAEGFHALHDWDGVAQRVNPDGIAVDVLNFLIGQRGMDATNPVVPAILIDYYFMHVLSLLSLRAWDSGDASANYDRIDALLELLQGPGGSGQRFADSAATLMLIATAHYERNENGYVTLLAQVRRLNAFHRTRIAVGHASAMGCHLRFGFEAQCGRDMVLLRDDNVADYPWLCFALVNVMREYARMREAGIEGRERQVVVEALLNGLTPDARAFVGAAPAVLSPSAADRAEFVELYTRYRDDLLREFEAWRPTDGVYSPLCFYFNFSHNVLKGEVVDALIWDEPWPLSLDDLFTGVPRPGLEPDDKLTLAATLMAYARSNPDRIRGRLMPVIVYDPAGGRQAYRTAIDKLKE